MLSTAFNIGASGLLANNAKVATHSANLANANTEGYRRRDDVFTEMQHGGVTYNSVHRFSAVTANRLSQLSGQEEASGTLQASLKGLQSQISSASTELAEAQNALATSLAQAGLHPADSTARSVAAAKANAVASIADSHLSEMSARIEDEQDAQGELLTQAAAKAQALAQLNKQVDQFGATPELKDKLAQTGRELAELVGGEVSFTSYGKAEFSIGGNKVVGADNSVKPFPAQVGGKVGGHAAAAVVIQAAKDKFTQGLQQFVDKMNTLNGQGHTPAGTPGANLFELNSQGFKFTGSADGLALQPVSGVNVAQAMSEVDALSKMTGSLASDVASKATLVKTTNEIDTMALDNWQAKYKAEEGVDTDLEAIAMKEAQRAYEANAKVISIADSMLGTLLSIKS